MVLQTYGKLTMPMTDKERLERRKLRFMKRVQKDPETGCWMWTGQKDSSAGSKRGRSGRRYGRFSVKKDKKETGWRAHRWAAKYIGGMEIEGMFVCHHCDVPLCVNPDHLFVGTAWDNMQDMKNKGRRKGKCQGSHHGRAILTEADIPVIRHLLAKGVMLKDIAPLFNVAPETIGDIKHGRHWSHV